MIRVKDMVQITMFAVIVFALEVALTFLPNVQLTVLLLVLYSKLFDFKKTALIIIIYTILDTLIYGIYGGINYYPFLLLGWIFIPITINTIFKRVENVYILSILGIVFTIFYSLMFVIADVIFLKVDFIIRMLSDGVFLVVFCASSFLSILWLYEPLKKILIQIDKR